MIDPNKVLVEAFDLGLLSVEVTPKMGGGQDEDGFPITIPPQVGLKASVGGVMVRLHSLQLPSAVPHGKAVHE
jgi:hypothetical protein